MRKPPKRAPAEPESTALPFTRRTHAIPDRNAEPEPLMFQEYVPARMSLFWVVESNAPRLNAPPVTVGPFKPQVPEPVAAPLLIVIEKGIAKAAGASARHPTSTKALSLLIMLPTKFCY